ncbi:histone acetyltransferase [Achlya hypogyna]|uniref:histone acetyltransferase n=1 Tax=Achlya hypogyna TaxID=1202772 RepID=A0A1V9YBQ2_ACHHY|nr:histone acetyltransferase [Achlya hypogyna]
MADTEDGPPPKKVKFQLSTSANDCVHLRIVHSASELDDDGAGFSPAFTYHAFGKEEVIYGYTGLRIWLTFAARTFDCLVEITYDTKDADAWDLFAKMQQSLPNDATQDKAAFLAKLEATSKLPLPGKLVSSYTTESLAFETYFSPLDDRGREYLNKMQKLSLWFIEGADDIDVADERWSLYTIFHKDANDVLRPAGYITMFTFHLPVSHGAMTKSKRICQVLVLPPYQRRGHGERLVELIMADARRADDIYEITVEDPVPGFARLRDVVDVKACVAYGFFVEPPTHPASGVAKGTQKCTATEIHHVKQALKITRLQVQRCYEALKLRWIDRNDEDAFKGYRLEVKRRLHGLHAEDLEAAASADRKKALLANLFSELEAEYDTVLSRTKLIDTTLASE